MVFYVSRSFKLTALFLFAGNCFCHNLATIVAVYLLTTWLNYILQNNSNSTRALIGHKTILHERMYVRYVVPKETINLE